MNLSDYRKIQKFLLASFCLSVALFTVTIGITSFTMFGSGTANSANTGMNTNVRVNLASPTPNINDNRINANNSTNNTPVNNAVVNNNSAANATKPAEEGSSGLVILGFVTFLTSITSLLGFISTTVLAWRKEKRDSDAIRIDNEKKELELAKLRLELEKMKSDAKESKPKRTRKPKKTE